MAIPLIALVAILLVNLISDPGFFSLSMANGRLSGSLIDILNRAAPVLLLAVGMTLVIATGGVDLSVGAVMAIGGATAACLITKPADCVLNGIPVGSSLPAILFVSLLVALICGLFNGLLVSVFELQPIVATLLLMVAGRGVAQLLTAGQVVLVHNDSFTAIGRGSILAMPNPVWLALAAAVLIGVLTRKTNFGLFLESVGSNPIASRLSGINAKTVKLAAYAICGLLAGVAGLIATADIAGADANNAGQYLELDAILAVAIGGTSMAGGRFTLVGTLLGALLMQALTTTILTRGVPPEVTLILKAVVVIGVCLFQSPKFKQKAPKKVAA